MVVSTALLLDNMLFMVIVPIIGTILNPDGVNETTQLELDANSVIKHSMDAENDYQRAINRSVGYDIAVRTKSHFDTSQGSEDISIGVLFASKAIVQLISNTVTGTFIDRVGYELPLLMGLTVMFSSTLLFAVCTR